MFDAFFGQEDVKQRLRNSRRNFFIFMGPFGYGKSYLAQCFAIEFGWRFVNVESFKSDDVREIIQDASSLSRTTLYLFDATLASVRVQSMLLKFLEDLPKNAKVVCCITSVAQLTPAILSRGQFVSFSPYEKGDIERATTDADILQYADSPGMAYQMLSVDVPVYIRRAELIIDKISEASLANVFNILSVVQEGTERIFLHILTRMCVQRIRAYEQEEICSAILRAILRHSPNLSLNIRIRALFEIMFIAVRDEVLACKLPS